MDTVFKRYNGKFIAEMFDMRLALDHCPVATSFDLRNIDVQVNM